MQSIAEDAEEEDFLQMILTSLEDPHFWEQFHPSRKRIQKDKWLHSLALRVKNLKEETKQLKIERDNYMSELLSLQSMLGAG